MKFVSTSFFIPSNCISRGQVKFPKDESTHVYKVMRASVGDTVRAVDGKGHIYWVKITRVDIMHSRGEIIETTTTELEPHTLFSLAMGTILPKRMEAAWDSCVQLGISTLIPVRTKFSLSRIREDGKFIDRLNAVGKRAMLQSGRAVHPTVEMPCELSEIVIHDFNTILFGDEEGLPTPPSEKPKLGEKVLLLVGPEGGFSAEEKRIIEQAGGVGISLGPRKLRAETAAVTLSVLALRWSRDI
ncbi:16S rRNA (uracil(1498)-N(3))-methyltransferase [bacterium]|nr:16S rRNA (uracil(1498)-N(3))-methyltransferase [bacterium]